MASWAVGVGHDPQALPEVWCADPRRADIERPAGVARSFHVSLNKVEPREASLARNLLAKHNLRVSLSDEVVPRRPQMPLISKPKLRASLAERLARTGTRPNRSIIWPAGSAKGERPDADTGEEVALGVRAEVIGVHVLYGSFVDVARRDVPGGNQVAEPLGGVGVVLVVVGDMHGYAALRFGCAP